MKKAQAPRELDKVIQSFSRRITFVRFDSFTAQQNLKEPHKLYTDALDQYKTQDRKKKRILYRGVAAYALDLRADLLNNAPKVISLDKKGVGGEDLLDELVTNFNTQLRWLLVSACEAYFIFLKELYGTLGYLDRNFWPCEHYGKIRFAEVKDQNLAWHKEQTRKLRSEDIFKVLRASFPNLILYECPSYNPNPKFWLLAIQKFRHAIVHSGAVIDVPALIDYLARALNIRVKNQFDLPSATKRALLAHIKMVDGKSEIWLVDETGTQDKRYVFIDRPFTGLVEKLSSHACLIYSCALEHFGHAPYWERKEN